MGNGNLAVLKKILKFDCPVDYVYDYIDSNMDNYFKKSGDSIDCFMDTLPGTRFAIGYINNEFCGWIQYKCIEETMIIITAYNNSKQGREFSKQGWKEFVDYAKSKGCKKIRMKTMRNHRIMRKLYKFKTVERIMETKI